MRIAILGFGREGSSLLKFLKKSPKYRGATMAILDQKLDKNYLKHLASFDLVFRSPGIPYNLPEIRAAIKKGVEFSSATKLFFDLCPSPIIGITGTKGKGTTSTLLYEILRKCGIDARLAGNIGKPAVDVLPKITKKSLVLLELSSFQLQDLNTSPHIAVVVDTFPDHLDVHKNIAEYLAAKSNITKYQKRSDLVFYFQDNLWSKRIALKSAGVKVGISGEPFGLKKNFVMAGTVAAHLGCSLEKIVKTIKNFKGLEHRLTLVRELKGARFYDDSASTNPMTSAAAIRQFADSKGIILIAGGKDKNLDYAPLKKAVQETGNVKLVILFGENKNKIKKQLSGIKCQLKIVGDLKSSVKLAYQKAKNSVVLFSPASASFDMFKDYQDRGEQFKKLVVKL